MQKEKAETAIQTIDRQEVETYNNYWVGIKPENDDEYYWRWIFSFLSVHTTWQKNVDSYLSLRETKDVWQKDKQELMNQIKAGGVGLNIRRTDGIWAFTDSFYKNPELWKKRGNESWINCRNRLANKCNGLGLAKTAFALEMCYPDECGSVCLDTHMLQLYGYTPKEQANGRKPKAYLQMEKNWAKVCKVNQIAPFMARSIFWDKNQQRTDSRYWTYIFEKKNELSTHSEYDI